MPPWLRLRALRVPPSKVQPFGGTSTEMDNHKTPAHFDPRRDDHLPPKSKNETCKPAWGTTALRKGEQKMLKDMMTTKEKDNE